MSKVGEERKLPPLEKPLEKMVNGLERAILAHISFDVEHRLAQRILNDIRAFTEMPSLFAQEELIGERRTQRRKS